VTVQPVSTGGLCPKRGRSPGSWRCSLPQGGSVGGRRPPGLLGSLATLLVERSWRAEEEKEEIKSQAQRPD